MVTINPTPIPIVPTRHTPPTTRNPRIEATRIDGGDQPPNEGNPMLTSGVRQFGIRTLIPGSLTFGIVKTRLKKDFFLVSCSSISHPLALVAYVIIYCISIHVPHVFNFSVGRLKGNNEDGWGVVGVSSPTPCPFSIRMPPRYDSIPNSFQHLCAILAKILRYLPVSFHLYR